MKVVYADQLYKFLTDVSGHASAHGFKETANCLDSARRFYLQPITSEFYGEAMCALSEVLNKPDALLSAEDRKTALDFVDSIRQQWFSVGGHDPI